MAFSGGVFSRIYNWVTDRNNGIDITASRMDQEFDGIATGLSQCILKDGTQTVTANIPMNSKKITGLADGTVSGDAVHYGQLATTTSSGIVELATLAETQAGTDTTRVPTVSNLPCVMTSTGSFSNQSNCDIAIPTGFEWVDIRIDNLVCSATGDITMRISTDGGSSYISTSSYVSSATGGQEGGAVYTMTSSDAMSGVLLIDNLSSSAIMPAALIVKISLPSSTSIRKAVLTEGFFQSSATDYIHFKGGGAYHGGTDDITNIRIFNFTSGTISFNYRVIGWR